MSRLRRSSSIVTNQNEEKPFKVQRRKVNRHIDEGIQNVELVSCKYELSTTGTELIKLDFKHIETGITDTFSLINGSAVLNQIMDVLDPTGTIEIDFVDYVGSKIQIEVKVVGSYRNIVAASSIKEHSPSECDEFDEDEYVDVELDYDFDIDDTDNLMMEDI